MEVHNDFKELLECFNAHRVEYLVVGSYARTLGIVFADGEPPDVAGERRRSWPRRVLARGTDTHATTRGALHRREWACRSAQTSALTSHGTS